MNANVLYDVGIALGCRRSEDVLLVRDDHDPFLFDVSTVPHANVNFSDVSSAVVELRTLLDARIQEQRFTYDARVERAMACLSIEEVYVLLWFIDRPPDFTFVMKSDSVLRLTSGVQRLLDQGLIRFIGSNTSGDPAYALTAIGHIVVERIR